jgi:thiol-disulfide isomerase/thioredoxin
MRRTVVIAIALLAVLAGCTGNKPPAPAASPKSPFAVCPPTTADVTTATAGQDALPNLTLPCFTGERPVSIARLGRPAVINLWASYCGPCRTELPALQDFADGVGGRVQVLGVATRDDWDKAAYAGADFGVRYANLYDPDQTLLTALGRNAIPVTLFVDEKGVVRHVDATGMLTKESIWAQVQQYLGIAP